MKKNIAVLVLVFSALAALAQSPRTNARPSPQDVGKEVDKLFTEWQNPDSPGAAVIVVRDGKTVYQNTYGAASLEYGIPVSSKTVFDIASVSKQFAGLAIAMLVDQKKVALEDDVHKYLPELPDFGKRITVGHLVHHTSGLRDWPEVLQAGGWQFDDVISYEQILTMVQHQRTLNFDPGEEELYSNTNYNLLAAIVERVSGQSFRQWTDANIFKPLGMKNTHFHDDYSMVVRNAAGSYYLDKDGKWKRATDNLTALGSSSLFTTIEDMGEWLKNFDQPRVGTRTTLDTMMVPGKLNTGKDNNYGFGLVVGKPYRGLKVVTHTGVWAGFRTAMVRFPDQKFSVAIFSNAASFKSLRTANAVADIYLGELMQEAPKLVAATTSNTTPVVTPEISIANLDEFVGEYYSRELAVSYSVAVRDGQIEVLNRHYPAIRFKTSAPDKFTSEDWQIEFVRNEDKVITGLVLTGERVRNIQFTRMNPTCVP